MSSSSRDTEPSQRDYRADIDGLRAVAILLVLLFHAWPSACSGGFVGVDVFFVISGYLITTIIVRDVGRRRFTFSHFYARRVRRLAPSLIVVVAATLAVGFFVQNPGAFARLSAIAGATALFGANLLIYRKTSYFDDIAGNNPLVHMWSLGVEEQFYLIWPVIIFFAARSRWRHATVISLATIALSSLIADLAIARSYPSADFFLLPSRLWEMAVGGLLAILHLSPLGQRWLQNRTGAVGATQGLIGLALIGGSAWGLSETNTYPGWWAMAPVAGSALLIDAGRHAAVNRLILAAAPMRFIGLISYQLYLWHWPLLTLARQSGHDDAGTILAAIAAAFLLSWLTQRYIERMFRNPLWAGTFPHRRAVPLLALGLVCLAVVGLTAPPGQSRFYFRDAPPWAKALATFRFNHVAAYRGGRCFLNAKQGPTNFAPDCYAPPTATQSETRLVLLWGDSHAASLYPGFQTLADTRHIRLAQFTTETCPPILGMNVALRPSCQAINNFVLGEVGALKPFAVILSANWALYSGATKYGKIDWLQVENTIHQVRNAGVQRVVVVGPLPLWRIPLSEAMIADQKRSGLAAVPARMKDYLLSGPFDVEPTVKAAAIGAGAAYVSPLSLMCDTGGCLTSVVQDRHLVPIAWDTAHLTSAGAIFLVNLMKPPVQIF